MTAIAPELCHAERSEASKRSKASWRSAEACFLMGYDPSLRSGCPLLYSDALRSGSASAQDDRQRGREIGLLVLAYYLNHYNYEKNLSYASAR